jgi:hypothetical protein
MSINFFSEVVQKSMMPPAKHLNYDDFPAADGTGVRTLSSPAVAAELSPSSTDGVIEVHPVSSDNDKWYLMPLVAGQRNSCLFDKIRASGTTVTLSDVTLFLPVF